MHHLTSKSILCIELLHLLWQYKFREGPKYQFYLFQCILICKNISSCWKFVKRTTNQVPWCYGTPSAYSNHMSGTSFSRFAFVRGIGITVVSGIHRNNEIMILELTAEERITFFGNISTYLVLLSLSPSGTWIDHTHDSRSNGFFGIQQTDFCLFQGCTRQAQRFSQLNNMFHGNNKVTKMMKTNESHKQVDIFSLSWSLILHHNRSFRLCFLVYHVRYIDIEHFSG